MNSTVTLSKEHFSRDERVLIHHGGLLASTFRYASGVEAVRISNQKGYVILLPFMGQMIWDMEFLGQRVVMRSIFDEPLPHCKHYGETYGCFLMHCGLTAMGNPTKEDTHPPHGELPIAEYKQAHLTLGEDEHGAYIALEGTYSHKCAFEINYDFCPECRLYENASLLDLTVTLKNKKDLPLEYFYLCHINYRPIDGARLYYTARHEDITVHHEVPEGYPKALADKTVDYLARLDQDPSLMDIIARDTQSYAPEIVFTCKYGKDQNGEAHTLQHMPNGHACYVMHRPDELPFGLRWISRTDDEDALGMVLPATAEHKG
ncbi:MAG: DUF4432 domain-containing protein, partial [Clostridia bacterium]|nr:DUF4432 domain-containing protein [Clostridia bacterium]